MSSEMKNGREDNMEVADEEVVVLDEYVIAFEELDKTIASDASNFLALLQNPRVDDAALKIKEQCIYKLARIYTETQKFEDVMSILRSNNDFFALIPKAKTAKIVRNILNIVSTIPDSIDTQVQLCKDVIEWCKAEKRTFLKQRIEAKLASLLLQKKQPSAALSLITSLLGELRKLDDKQMLTEAQLTESRIYHALQNIPKSKASLTASRTAANSIYVSPLLQAEIDEMSGILHCEEGDHVTAYSYFLEAFEAYDTSKDARAIICLKYMLLAKILSEAPGEVPGLLTSKLGIKHTGPHLDAMAAIARSAKSRSLEAFQEAVTAYEVYLKTDDLIAHQLDELYEKMLEGNLLKIIHPYSCIEISHVATLIKLPIDEVERKLSQMILDHRFSGILDQGCGQLIIYDEVREDVGFTKGKEIIANVGLVVEALFARTKALSVTSATSATGGSTVAKSSSA